MDITHIERDARGAFLIKIDGKRVAELTYEFVGPTRFNIDHTQVDESLRGQKIGDKLLLEAVKFAREKGLEIVATCPFALKKLQENPDYADVFAG